VTVYKLCFYVPASHLEAVKEAVFATGAGRIGDYDSCCWQVAGQGQFRPLAGSQPFIGSQGTIEQVEEYRVELVCADQVVRAAVAALYDAHPYEEPAWDLVALANDDIDAL
jgi:hypothetical protein